MQLVYNIHALIITPPLINDLRSVVCLSPQEIAEAASMTPGSGPGAFYLAGCRTWGRGMRGRARAGAAPHPKLHTKHNQFAGVRRENGPSLWGL